MKPILVGALAAVFSLSRPSLAQLGCAGQLKPLKPVTAIGCSDAVPICVCDSRGDCGWGWTCGAPGNTVPFRSESRIDLSIPLQTRGTPTPDALERLIRVQRLRNSARKNEVQAPLPSVVPPVQPTQQGLTDGWLNGDAWRASSDLAKNAYVAGYSEAVTLIVADRLVEDERAGREADALARGAVAMLAKYSPAELTLSEKVRALDRFYEDASNARVTLVAALQIVAAGAEALRQGGGSAGLGGRTRSKPYRLVEGSIERQGNSLVLTRRHFEAVKGSPDKADER